MSENVAEISKRNLTVLAVVVACFAVLWPKIFYPMVVSIIYPTDNEDANQDEIRKLDFNYMLNPQMREAMGEARPLDKAKKDNKVLFHPSVMHAAVRPQSKEGGAMNLLIPVYTIAIILFFIYSLSKTVFKKNQDACQVLNLKNQRPTCVHISSETEDVLNKRKDVSQERKTQRALEQYGKDKVLTALKTIILEMEEFKGNK